MTTPTLLPTNFFGTAVDYLQVKCSRDGDAFVNRGQVSIPSGTTTTTIAGLFPFQSGMTLVTGGTDIVSDALGTSVTVSIGVVYDDNVGNTNNQTLFTNASTAAAAGGPVPITESATNLPYVTTGNGWVVATIGGATTGSTGNIYIQALCDYFNGGKQP
jgi:hypothetical protein